MCDEIRVLHVDDDHDFAALTATVLERGDDQFDVTTAHRPSEGLSLLASEPFDCVISDYEMPRTNGIEFLGRVREEYPDLPFVLFTGKGSEAVASEAISAGVTDYLQKQRGTKQYELLANRLRNAVAQRRAERRAAETTRRYEVLFTHTPNAIVSVTLEDGVPIIQSVNPAFEALFVPTRTDPIGQNLDDLVTGTDAQAERARKITERTRAGETTVWEVTRETVDGPRDFRLHAIPIESPAAAESAYAVYADVTDLGEEGDEA
ncbi:response regulator [Haloarcula salina]|uniref:response regulator n=1 Tax=Haloarcula salina TaxID=1429914 RepID=UPI003C6FDD51